MARAAAEVDRAARLAREASAAAARDELERTAAACERARDVAEAHARKLAFEAGAGHARRAADFARATAEDGVERARAEALEADARAAAAVATDAG